MKLISILTELLLKVLFINLGKVMRLERALWADTLVQSKKTYGLFTVKHNLPGSQKSADFPLETFSSFFKEL